MQLNYIIGQFNVQSALKSNESELRNLEYLRSAIVNLDYSEQKDTCWECNYVPCCINLWCYKKGYRKSRKRWHFCPLPFSSYFPISLSFKEVTFLRNHSTDAKWSQEPFFQWRHFFIAPLMDSHIWLEHKKVFLRRLSFWTVTRLTMVHKTCEDGNSRWWWKLHVSINASIFLSSFFLIEWS